MADRMAAEDVDRSSMSSNTNSSVVTGPEVSMGSVSPRHAVGFVDRPRFPSRTYSIGATLDVPNQVGNTGAELVSPYVTPLAAEETTSPHYRYSRSESVEQCWLINYSEAAIYLQEGENNDKFHNHPKSQAHLPAYLIVHNHYFYCLDLAAAILLLSLVLFEKPAVPLLEMPVGLHGSLEILALVVIMIEVAMKARWLGFKNLLTHVRTAIKMFVLVIMLVEVVVVLVRQENHFRVTRALRPIFLIDTYYCGGVRRFIRQILQSLPPILDMLMLLLFFMGIFSVLGFYLFGGDLDNPYFSSFVDSFISLFVLLTTANYPDVMMPAYHKHSWSVIFFIAYLAVELYFLMNLMLAVVYDAFTNMEKIKFKKLLLHRRSACRHAFKLLVSRQNPDGISLRHFEGLMKYFKPGAGRRDVYLMFKIISGSTKKKMGLEDFYNVYDISSLKWKKKMPKVFWYERMSIGCCKKVFSGITWFVKWKWFENFIYAVIGSNCILLIIDTIYLTESRTKLSDLGKWSSVTYVIIYSLEVIMKLIGFGPKSYFLSAWNVFDFLATLTAVGGMLTELVYHSMYFLLILRPLRLLRLFKLKRRYRDVLGTFAILLPRMMSVAIVLLLTYYFFGIIGMECFSDVELKDCCKNTMVADYYTTANTSFLYYYDNNFKHVLNSGVTLFELTVVNNWFVIMDGYAFAFSQYSRLYFMTFYITTMVVMTIVVAFILEAFLFRIEVRREVGDEGEDDEKSSILRYEVQLQRDELEMIDRSEQGEGGGPLRTLFSSCRSPANGATPDSSRHRLQELAVTFNGKRMKTKMDLCCRMYAAEVKEWLDVDASLSRQVSSAEEASTPNGSVSSPSPTRGDGLFSRPV